MSLTETQKAWLAGFIDGEGYLGITFQRKKENKQQSATPRYHPYSIVTNGNKAVLEYIRELIGDGRIYRIKVKALEKPCFQYKLTKAQPLKDLLLELRNYLRVKQRQCDVLLEYLNIREKRKIASGAGSRGLTSFSKEEEEIYQKLRNLNKYGLH